MTTEISTPNVGIGNSPAAANGNTGLPMEERTSIIVRLAGDSGDGMQLAGGQFTNTAALLGNDISTLPDFPAEIRAPAGTLAGVSGFQIHFSSVEIKTPGDSLDALVAMNPAALKVNLGSVQKGGLVIVNSDSFTDRDLQKANLKINPLDEPRMQEFKLLKVAMTSLTREALKDLKLSTREMDRCKNFFALGLLYWLYDRPLEPTEQSIIKKFKEKYPIVCEANLRVLKAGWAYGETLEVAQPRVRVAPAQYAPGTYRQITGNEALAYGMVTAARRANKPMVYCSYPITPASDILHELSKLKNFGIYTFQAEDEIAAMAAAIGAGYGGALGATGTSGPGLALKMEAIGLAVMTELPVVVIDVQRGGPSTGLPTKTEQADLLQAMFGRNGESPVPILAAAHPTDCFWLIQEAFRIAVQYMTPVIFLSDGYVANSAEPWAIPSLDQLPPWNIQHPGEGFEFLQNGSQSADHSDSNGANGSTKPFAPYLRNERQARPWAIPGMAGMEHRVGGLEKENITGQISYDAQNHHFMVNLRQSKVDGIAKSIPPLSVQGPETGDLLVVSWGGTFGAVNTAVAVAQKEGLAVAHAHLHYLNPLPGNTLAILQNYRRVLVPELNLGQLRLLLRGRFALDILGYNKVQGLPFNVHELVTAIRQALETPAIH